MWIIISTAIPIVLSIYGLSRLQHNRNSHGAQSSSCRTYLYAQFYSHENPELRRSANILQTAEEQDAEAHKYLVKWDSDEESEQSSAFPLPIDMVAVGVSSVEEPKRTYKHKSKHADVKWDTFEEE